MLKILLLIVVSFLFSCGDKNLASLEPSFEPAKPETTLPSGFRNYWSEKETWGKLDIIINSDSQQSLTENSAVHESWKRNFPKMTKTYVLFRVRHNGSCWIHAALAVLISNLIDSGSEKFAKAVETYESLGKENAKISEAFKKFYESEDFKKFMEAFRWMNNSRSFKTSLNFMNHENVGQALVKGMRAYIASDRRKKGYVAEAEKLESQPSCWGFVGDADFMFDEAGLDLPGFTMSDNGKEHYFYPIGLRNTIVKNAPKIKQMRQEQKNGAINFPQARWNLAINQALDAFFAAGKNLSKIMYFRSSPGFMDVAARADFAKTLRD